MPDRGSDVYADNVTALCTAEDARKTSFESRGISVITTSGTLVTLLFGLVAVVTAAKNFALPTAAHGYLVAAIIGFGTAALLGIVVNAPLRYDDGAMTVEEIAANIGDPVIVAEGTVMGRRLQRLSSARRMNSWKGRFLVAACSAEVFALVMLLLGVVYILQGNPHPANS